MLPFKRILAPTDFSQPSFDALAVAGEMAAHFGAETVVLHVVPSVPRPTWALQLHADPEVYETEIGEYEEAMRSTALRKLEETVQERTRDDVKYKTLVSQGDAAAQIVEAASREGADLIVIATHGLTGWRHLVFGSVTEKVLRLAESPVLVIRAASK